MLSVNPLLTQATPEARPDNSETLASAEAVASAERFAPIETLVPHRPPMLLIDRVLARTHDEICVAVRPEASQLFANADGSIPAYVGMEYMAQAIAAYGGMEARAQGRAPSVGFLLGSRRFEAQVDSFTAEVPLQVRARELLRDETNLVLFDCRIHAGDRLLAQAQIKAIQPESIEPMAAQLAALTLV